MGWDTLVRNAYYLTSNGKVYATKLYKAENALLVTARWDKENGELDFERELDPVTDLPVEIPPVMNHPPPAEHPTIEFDGKKYFIRVQRRETEKLSAVVYKLDEKKSSWKQLIQVTDKFAAQSALVLEDLQTTDKASELLTNSLLKFILAETTIDKSKISRERDDKVQGFQLSNLNCIDLD